MTEGDVYDAIRKKGPIREPAHVWIRNVRNRTGYSGEERYADALVVSVWPSRGIWFGGVEIKVSRNDWRRELDQPEKSAAIQKFCTHWWVAAPDGVVKPEEVPATWGHLAVGKKVVAAKAAPALEPEAPTCAFVASILRNMAGTEERLRSEIRGVISGERARDPLQERVWDLQEKVRVAERERDSLKQQLGYKEADLAALRENVKAFEEAAGVKLHEIEMWRGTAGVSRIGETFKAARVMAEARPAALAAQFQAVADALLVLANKEES